MNQIEERPENEPQGTSVLPEKGSPTVNLVVLLLVGVALFFTGYVSNSLFFSPSADAGNSAALLTIQSELSELRQQVTHVGEQLTKMQSDLGIVRDSALGIVQVSTDDDPALGSEDASIVIVEFSDFQCPYCKKFHQETLGQLIEEYVNTGVVRFVFRDFPLTQIHPNAVNAALAAECADDQGQFWAMHNLLFETQNEWSKSTDLLSLLMQFADQLGLEHETYSNCMNSQLHYHEIGNDLQNGVDYGVTGTPYLFVNGMPLNGAVPISALRQVIETELERLGK